MADQIAGAELIRRAIRCRCPLCGRGAIFRTHFRMNRTCPNCHAIFWKDPGESLGAMYLDYIGAFSVFLAGWLLLDLTTGLSDWWMCAILSAAAAASVFVLYPVARSFWTLLVYLSGGIERPPMRVIQGGRKAS